MKPGDSVRVLADVGFYSVWGIVKLVDGGYHLVEAGPANHKKSFWLRSVDVMPAAEWRRGRRAVNTTARRAHARALGNT